MFTNMSDKPRYYWFIGHVGKHSKNANILTRHDNIFKKLEFLSVISNSSIYGIIWNGTYNGIPCAIKMVKLEGSDIHHNDEIPFLHKEFVDKKSMDENDFIY